MNEPITFLSSVLAILGLWIAFDAGYRAYRINVLRDRLFELRSELFEAARSGLFGDKGFSDPVYCHTRRVLNGSIRFAHHMTLSRLFVLLWSSRWWPDEVCIKARDELLDRVLAQHDPKTREMVARITRESDFAIVMHMLHVNIFGFAFISLVDVSAYCFRAQQRARAFIAQKIVRNRRMLEPLEQDALCGLDR